MEALKWLQDIMDLLVRLIPRPRVVPSTHGAVAFVRGKPYRVEADSRRFWWPFDRRRKQITPGCWYWYWPIWTEVYETPIVRQTLNLQSQALMCKNGGMRLTPIVVGGVVVYSVPDAFKALTEVHDLDSAIEDLALTSIRDVLWGKTLDEIYEKTSEINLKLRRTLTEQVRRFGVKIHNVFLSDNSLCTTIKMMDAAHKIVPLEPEVEEEAE